MEAWGEALHYPDIVSSLRRVKALIHASLLRGYVRSPFAKLKLINSRKTWHPKIKSVILQMAQLVKVTGFRRPNSSLLDSIVARARMFWADAAALACAQESSDLADSNRT